MVPFSSETLVLELEFARSQKAGDPYGFCIGPQDYILRTSGGSIESAPFLWDRAFLEDLQRIRRPGRDPVTLHRIGEALRQFLVPLGWAEQTSRILDAIQQGRRVVLTIRSAAAELYALPWELLTLKASGQHIGELPSMLVRYEWPGTTTAPMQPTADKGRILLAWSAAGGAVPAAEHQQAIQDACHRSGHFFDPTSDVLKHASLRHLSAALAAAKQSHQPITVLHLLCHGGAAGSTFGLVLDGDEQSGDSVVIDGGRLRQIFDAHAGMIRLVVLAACDSGNTGELGNHLGSVAQALHRIGIPAVVASRYPLSVKGSISLTRSLYSSLLQADGSLESAMLSSRQELALLAEDLDWLSLQLYARSADGINSRPLMTRQGPPAPITPSDAPNAAPSALAGPPQSRSAQLPLLNFDAAIETPSLLVGMGINQYVLQKYIAKGGSGMVFEAWNKPLGRQACIKILYPFHDAEETIQSSLARSIRGLAQLNHNGIIKIYDFGPFVLEDKKSFCLTMELVKGSSLETWSDALSDGKDGFAARLKMAYNIVAALDVAHHCRYLDDSGFEQTGILHGDIKPDNILVRSNSSPVVLDFMLFDVQRALVQGYAPRKAIRLFDTGAYGTPGYMAPEQEVRGIVTVRSDIYSLGVTLLQLFNSQAELVTQPLVDLLAQMSAIEPEHRPESMAIVKERLVDIARQSRVSVLESTAGPSSEKNTSPSLWARLVQRIRGD